MTRAQLLFKTGKHTYSGKLACTRLRSLCQPLLCVVVCVCFCFPQYSPLCALRFLPPAYSISSRMLTQTPMSPYMSPISTYQVLKSAQTPFFLSYLFYVDPLIPSGFMSLGLHPEVLGLARKCVTESAVAIRACCCANQISGQHVRSGNSRCARVYRVFV